MKLEQTECSEICHWPDLEQAEVIADRFSAVSNEYSHIDSTKLNIPLIPEGSVFQFSPLQVLYQLLKLKVKKSTGPHDIPAVIILEYAEFLCVHLSHILSTCVKRGEYPRILKVESQIPIPKKYPVTNIEGLRNISILKKFSKVAETMLSSIMVSDMKENMDKYQFGN